MKKKRKIIGDHLYQSGGRRAPAYMLIFGKFIPRSSFLYDVEQHSLGSINAKVCARVLAFFLPSHSSSHLNLPVTCRIEVLHMQDTGIFRARVVFCAVPRVGTSIVTGNPGGGL